MKIGILGFQGAIVEHQWHIEKLGHEAVNVRYPEQLEELNGIILPGGESTTIGKLLVRTGMMKPLRRKIENGLPVWGTCAGMILLAKELENDPVKHLAVMDICVRRNAYGTQIDSFDTALVIPAVAQQAIPLVFIRAPYITRIGEKVEVLCEIDGHIVAARERNMLVTSFHPELTEEGAFHQYFLRMCGMSKN
ncbi:pyridoxal 5'-phosphate synthase glutaminase subunit PdxT [Odoribacter lunatus]|uniref:pyridoxal 5'-phosphate synthase glutaminase subunit PdxT n=1 Tax=Odoribacter lunatus TaxID=2941335 RepID=UPI00203D012F|nr:pyridoxal 5'-phosphate synthase glutaminase subunit PdxT [Odoribacter lunatus]